ncbi:MAG: hypothetical protein ACP5SJ_01430 [Candidatus Micrarchaeia archaeon]
MEDIEQVEISLDTRAKGADMDFISHAHTDHISAAKASKRILASRQTERLLEKVYSIKINGKEATGSKNIKMLSAGHILGSRQLLIDDESEGNRILYSGDFQIETPIATEHIETARADTLILDSTYPQLGLKFDPKEEVGDALAKWVENRLDKGIVLISAYAIGKSQELIKLLNEHGLVPIVSSKISKASGVYNEYGEGLKFFSAFGEGEDYESELKRNFIGITEKNISELAAKLSSIYRKKIFTAVATGFSKLYKFDTDAQFAISDHADFYQRLEYIDRVSPKSIFTYGKEAEILAENLRKAGYNAMPYKGKTVSVKAQVALDINILKSNAKQFIFEQSR